MDAQLELKLIECLSLLDEGEPIERILARFPDDAAHLAPMLETAAALPAMRVEPTEVARITSRRVFLGQAAVLREASARRSFPFMRRLAIGLASLALAFVFAGGALVASASALPNEALYPVKRAVEDTQLLLAGADRETLATRFEQRRRDEVTALLADGHSAAVEFEGIIEAIQPDQWVISGLTTRVGQSTPVAGIPQIGARARVQGRTDGGVLVATFITVEPGALPAAAPTATATPSSTPRPSPSPIPSPSATTPPTAKPSPAPTRAPSPTPRPAATARPSAPPPTQIPPTEPPAPTSTPEEEVEFSGVVASIGGSWTIGGTQVLVNGETELRGQIGIGDRVRVRARRLPDGQLLARRIERVDSPDGNDQNTNGNDNGNDGNDNGGGGGDDHGGGGNDSGGSGGGNDSSGGGGNDNGGGGGGNDNGGGNKNDNGGHNSGGHANSGM